MAVYSQRTQAACGTAAAAPARLYGGQSGPAGGAERHGAGGTSQEHAEQFLPSAEQSPVASAPDHCLRVPGRPAAVGHKCGTVFVWMELLCGDNLLTVHLQIFYYSVSIFKQAGLSPQAAELANLGAGSTNLAAALLGPMLMERFNRRPLMLFSSFFCCVFLFLFAILLQFIVSESY